MGEHTWKGCVLDRVWEGDMIGDCVTGVSNQEGVLAPGVVGTGGRSFASEGWGVDFGIPGLLVA